MIALYITDIHVEYKTKSKLDLHNMTAKQRDKYIKKRVVENGETKIETFYQTLRNMPVIMLCGMDFASDKYEQRFIEKHGRVPIGKLADYDVSVEFKNTKFSSNLQYVYKD